MLYNYSVTPLAEDHFEQRCEEIIKNVESKAIYMPIFSMTLVPEGTPVIDKVSEMARIYAKYRDALEKRGVESGIMVQASLGHGYGIIPNPFQKYVNVKDGKEAFVCCPEDENFINHFCEVLKTLARQRPKAIMLDDDFRLMIRPGRGCACPLHMKEFNKRTGLNMTQEELTEHIFSHDENDPLTDVFRDTQRDSLIKAATKFREAIDSVDPTIQGINCTSGNVCESVMFTNKIFAGKGNPTIVRVPDGCYAPLSVREFSRGACNSAICISKLKKAGIDIILSETDTIPFNRYAKSASMLHALYSAAILEGAQGAKHWITRMSAFETKSAKAYRDILSKNNGFYEKLSEYSKQIKWVGANVGFVEQEKVRFQDRAIFASGRYSWAVKVFERMGLPFYFAEMGEKATFVDEDVVTVMTDEQIKKLFEGSVFVDGESAKMLVERGYGDLLGVDVADWDLGLVSSECFDMENRSTCTKQKNLKKLTITNSNAKALSFNHLKFNVLAPAVTTLKRDDGKISVVYCGSRDAECNYIEGFAFLNASRKEQFVELLKEADALPIYCDGDDEICLRAGFVTDGRLLASVCKLGIDPLDSLKVYLAKEPKSIFMLEENGEEQPVEFEALGDNLYEIKQKVETMNPLVMLIG